MRREIVILWAGRHQRNAWETLCRRYRDRIGRFVPVRELPVKVRAAGDGIARQRAETKALLDALPDPCWTIALDARGRSMSSEKLAAELARLQAEWPHPIAFVLGSDLGLSDELKGAARRVLSFGPMTLSHELARLVLYEQIYRALAIGAGIKYHRGSL